MIGIISYLPDEPVLRERRFRCCVTTLNFCRQLFPEERIVVIAQNYNNENFEDSNVTIAKYDKLGPHGARNKILEQFYNSSDTWLYMCDDDVIAYDYYDANGIVRDIYYGRLDKAFDMVIPLMPEFVPFKKLNVAQKVEQQIVFTPLNINSCPNIMLLRNSDKHIYYDSSIDLSADNAVSEDLKFLSDCMYAGKRLYRLDCWIKKSLAFNHSTIFSDITKTENERLHKKLTDNFRNYIISTYGVKDFNEFKTRYNKSVGKYIVTERVNHYVLPDNLKPKTQEKNKALF